MKASLALVTVQPTCGNCKRFRRTDGEDWGICKAGPPLAQMLIDANGDPYQVTYWPQLDITEPACDQFKAGQ